MNNVYPWCDFSLYAALPFLILSITNSLIIYHVVHAQRRRAAMQSGETGSGSKLHSMTVMLISVSLAFLVFTLPYCVNYISLLVFHRSSINLFMMSSVIMAANHCVNFALYSITGQTFKRELKDMLTCC